MRYDQAGSAGQSSAIKTRRALALGAGILACMLAALAPTVASASSVITITPAFPPTVAVGDTGVVAEVVVTNQNTAPDSSTTICNFGDTGSCAGSAGITLIPSCSQLDISGCSPAGADPNVFGIAPTAIGTASSACPGRQFSVTVINATFGTVRIAPTSGNLVLAAGAACHIRLTFDVLKLPADAQAATGLQTRQRVLADAVSDTDTTTSSSSAAALTVKLAAPSLTDTDPDSPANDNFPEIKGSAPAGTVGVTLYATSDCTGAAVASGSAATFASPGFTANVSDDSSTTFSATVTDSASGVSACSPTTIAYVEDSTPPTAPSPNDTDPDSPANNNAPRVKGSAATASTVRVYANATCTGSPAATGTAAAFASPGLTINVADNSTTAFYATATDTAANVSACSSAHVTYVEDSLAPAAPTPTGTSPASPFNDNTPRIIGAAEAGSTVTIYPNAGCSGTPIAQGSSAGFASPGIQVSVNDDSTTTFYAVATDQAGNDSACSSGVTYVEDSQAPAGPVLSGTSPASPANENGPRITGSAPAGTTVKLYTDFACTGAVAGQGSAAALASPGISVAVADNSTTTFYARATDAASNVSGCSPSSATYVEDSVAPLTAIDSGPSGSGASATPTYTFSSSEAGATFECRIDSGAFAPCTSPFTTATLAAGTHTFEVRSRDSAGNLGSTVTRQFTVAGATPPPPGPPPPPPPAGPPAQPGCTGIAGALYVGTSAKNVRTGSAKTDIMFGLAGNDSLRGVAGLDCLYGGAGKDVLRGGSGPDRLFGGTGNDRLDGGSGNDRLSGQAANDRVDGSSGNDRDTGGAGRDVIVDRRGTDHLSGGSGNDRIDARDSTLAGRRKADRILCGAGVDTVLADPIDKIARDCERGRVTRRSLKSVAAR